MSVLKTIKVQQSRFTSKLRTLSTLNFLVNVSEYNKPWRLVVTEKNSVLISEKKLKYSVLPTHRLYTTARNCGIVMFSAMQNQIHYRWRYVFSEHHSKKHPTIKYHVTYN